MSIICFLILFVPLKADTSRSAIELYNTGKDAVDAGNYFLGIEKYKAALAVNPHYLDAYKGLAESYYYLGEYDEALRNIASGKKYNKNDVFLLNMEGRIWVVKNNLDRAKTFFQAVLAREPNNIEAMTGIALLDVAAGRTRYAAKQCEDALKLNPTHRVTLLSLAIIYNSLNDAASAEKYLELAAKYHSNNALVHYTAGKFYYTHNNSFKAESHLKTALGLDGNFHDARMLLGNLYIIKGNYSRAIEILPALLAADMHNTYAHYSQGIALWKNGDIDFAIEKLEQAFRLKPDDEIIRLTLEKVITQLPAGSQKREDYAGERLKQGKLFEARNLYTPAMLEYRKSIKLYPSFKAGNLAFAGIFKKRGFPMKYLSKLEMIREKMINGKPDSSDRFVLDEIEYFKSRAIGSVAEKWGIDQHNHDIRSHIISLFYTPAGNSVIHPLSDGIVAEYFRDVLDGYGKLLLEREIPLEVSSFEQAFRQARAEKSDFFLVFSFDESERAFTGQCILYLSRTGTELARFRVERTGNDRIRDALLRLGNNLNDLLPLRGVLLKKEFDTGVIDLGTIHGLKKDDVLLIVKQGRVALRTDAIGFSYNKEDVVGEITITQADEAVSEGTLKKNSFYDYITAGDEVLYFPGGIPKLDETSGSASPLLQDLMILK